MIVEEGWFEDPLRVILRKKATSGAPNPMTRHRIAIVVGSLRTDSINRKVAKSICAFASKMLDCHIVVCQHVPGYWVVLGTQASFSIFDKTLRHPSCIKGRRFFWAECEREWERLDTAAVHG